MDPGERCGLDIDLASEVQQILFPKSSPVCDWCCMGVKNRMAQGLGGDYFDFITMPDNCQAIILGDVTGHGLHASVVMSLLYGFLYRATMERCAPLETVQQANRFLASFARRSSEYDHFFSATLFFSVIDPDTLKMNYVNCGHLPPLVRQGDKVLTLPPTGPPIGFFDEPEMDMRTFQFEANDRLLLYTDGLTETVNAQNEPFGLQRLIDFLLSNQSDHMEFLDLLFQEIENFEDTDVPTDDCTAIVTDFHRLFQSAR